jgi:hypothetical protein
VPKGSGEPHGRPRFAIHCHQFSGFGAVSTTVLFGDFLSGCLVLFASLFMVFEVSLEIETQWKGKK